MKCIVKISTTTLLRNIIIEKFLLEIFYQPKSFIKLDAKNTQTHIFTFHWLLFVVWRVHKTYCKLCYVILSLGPDNKYPWKYSFIQQNIWFLKILTFVWMNVRFNNCYNQIKLLFWHCTNRHHFSYFWHVKNWFIFLILKMQRILVILGLGLRILEVACNAQCSWGWFLK